MIGRSSLGVEINPTFCDLTIRNVQSVATVDRSLLEWRVGSVGMRLYLAPMPDAGLLVGVAPSNPASEKLSSNLSALSADQRAVLTG